MSRERILSQNVRKTSPADLSTSGTPLRRPYLVRTNVTLFFFTSLIKSQLHFTFPLWIDGRLPCQQASPGRLRPAQQARRPYFSGCVAVSRATRTDWHHLARNGAPPNGAIVADKPPTSVPRGVNEGRRSGDSSNNVAAATREVG